MKKAYKIWGILLIACLFAACGASVDVLEMPSNPYEIDILYCEDELIALYMPHPNELVPQEPANQPADELPEYGYTYGIDYSELGDNIEYYAEYEAHYYEYELPAEPVEVERIRSNLDPYRPMIALTFDDGPVQNTALLLDLLENYDARVTFFVLGSQIGEHEDVVKRAFDMGHEIAGHSWSHGNMHRLDEDAIRAEILSAYYAIMAVTGYSPMMFRPPYGNANQLVREVAYELDFAIVNWSVDPRDWQTQNAYLIYHHVMDNVADGLIVVMHEWVCATIYAMEYVIPQLIDRGYQLVTVSELFYHSGITPQPGVIYRRGR